jgi:lipopolysaccharide transport system ATP-binding protein
VRTQPWAVRCEDVSKRFRIYHEKNMSLKQTVLRRGRSRFEEFWAVKDVSVEVPHGQALAIIGRNGSGKSTLLKCIAGILQPERGKVSVDGRLAALLELGAGFYPEYTGRENIYLNGALHGLSRRYIDSVMDKIIEFSDIPRFIDNTVKTYSSGMFARLGFAIAVHMDPEILVVDEILSVGDEAFQRRCFDRISELKAEGRTMVIVSHSLDVVKRLCSTGIWMDAGSVRSHGPITDVIQDYLADVSEHMGLTVHADSPGVHIVLDGRREGVGVREVRLSGPKGPADVFHTGDPIEVRITYRSEGPLRGAEFHVELVPDGEGIEAFWTTSGTKTSERELAPEGAVTLRIPRLGLLAGRYRVGLSIVDRASGHEHIVLSRALPIEVTNEQSDYRGIADMQHQWVVPGDRGVAHSAGERASVAE